MFIYKISSPHTDKVYVGQTIQNIDRRWAHHIWKANSGKNHPLYASMRKHGIESFRIEILQTLPNDVTQEDLDDAEIHWINLLKSIAPTGLNVKPGGEGQFKMTMEHKLAISAAKTAQWATVEKSAEIKDRMRQMALGNTHRRGQKASAETRAKISAAQLGREVSEETKAKMSATHKARLAEDSTRTPAQLEALAKAREKLKGREPWNKGKKATDEAKANQSESHKGKIPWNKGKKKKVKVDN